MFERIGLAITFSPNVEVLVAEAIKLKNLFKAKLILIHIHHSGDDLKSKFDALIKKFGLTNDDYKLVSRIGNVEESILDVCEEEKIDLLIAGAKQKENFLKYYTGSIARKIMRDAPCSVLLLTNPTSKKIAYRKICACVDFSYQSEIAAKKTYEFAKLNNLDELFLIREFQIPGLATTVYDSGSKEETRAKRHKWLDEENQKMKLFVQELNLTDIKVNTVCLYGKQGWEASHWVHENNGDLFVIATSSQKSSLIDKIFLHDLEFIYKDLPCSLLIIK